MTRVEEQIVPAVLPEDSRVPAERRRHPVRRIARIAGGWTLLVIGAALLVLPGPGLLVIAGGLALLATEYAWAARWLRAARQRIDAARRRVTRNDDADPREP
jgi:uncharacterized protein (TIGR02611 family)